MRCNDMTPFSSSVGDRKIMNHFVVSFLLSFDYIWLRLRRATVVGASLYVFLM
jgi:hypothetical protein